MENKDLNSFLLGYTEAMLNSLSSKHDKKVSLSDFEESSKTAILNDCFSFTATSEKLISEALKKDDTYSWKMAGWDFWETRNSTGMGFEDKFDFEENRIWKNLFSRAHNKPVEIEVNDNVYSYISQEHSYQNPEILKAIKEKRELENVIPKTYEGVKEMVESENISNRPKMRL